MKPNQQTMLSEALIPNSVAYRKSNLERAQEALKIAKSIPRVTRRAKSNECEFSRELENRKHSPSKSPEAREDGFITATYAREVLGISQFTIQEQRKKGLLPFKKEKAKYFYDPEELKKIQVRIYKKKKDNGNNI